jgi:hypothetical protein
VVGQGGSTRMEVRDSRARTRKVRSVTSSRRGLKGHIVVVVVVMMMMIVVREV